MSASPVQFRTPKHPNIPKKHSPKPPKHPRVYRKYPHRQLELPRSQVSSNNSSFSSSRSEGVEKWLQDSNFITPNVTFKESSKLFEEDMTSKDIINALQVLSKANLLEQNETLMKISEMMNQSDSGEVEYYLDLLSIQKLKENASVTKSFAQRQTIEESFENSNLEYTTPRSSYFANGEINTITSSGQSYHDVNLNEILSVPSMLDILGLKNIEETSEDRKAVFKTPKLRRLKTPQTDLPVS